MRRIFSKNYITDMVKPSSTQIAYIQYVKKSALARKDFRYIYILLKEECGIIPAKVAKE